MRYPPSPLGPPAEPAPAPEEVRIATQLWWGVVAVGLVRVIAGVLALLDRRAELERGILDAARASDPNAPLAAAQLAVSIIIVFTIVAGLGLLAVTAAVAHQFGRGRSWARVVLTIGGILLLFDLLTALFAVSGGTGAAAFVAGAAGVLQGVLAAGALFLGYRPAANGYFSVNRR